MPPPECRPGRNQYAPTANNPTIGPVGSRAKRPWASTEQQNEKCERRIAMRNSLRSGLSDRQPRTESREPRPESPALRLGHAFHGAEDHAAVADGQHRAALHAPAVEGRVARAAGGFGAVEGPF